MKEKESFMKKIDRFSKLSRRIEEKWTKFSENTT